MVWVFLREWVHSYQWAVMIFCQDDICWYVILFCHILCFALTLPLLDRKFCTGKMNTHPVRGNLYCSQFFITLEPLLILLPLPSSVFTPFVSLSLASIQNIYILSDKLKYINKNCFKSLDKKNQRNIKKSKFITQILFFFLWNTFHTQIANPISIMLKAIPIQLITTSINNTYVWSLRKNTYCGMINTVIMM